MKQLFAILAFIMVFPAGLANAQESLGGLGAGVGSFNGGTFMFYLETYNWEFGVGVETVGEDATQIQTSWRWNLNEGSNFNIYAGAGGRLKFEDNTRLGVIVPIGMNYFGPRGILEYFFEITPTIDIEPSGNGRIGLFFGIRHSL